MIHRPGDRPQIRGTRLMSSAGTAPTIKTLMKASGNERAVDAEQDHTETELYPLSVKFFENPSHEHWTMVQLMRKILQR